MLQLDNQDDNDETMICCKGNHTRKGRNHMLTSNSDCLLVVQTGASKGEKESREILRMYVDHHTERAKALRYTHIRTHTSERLPYYRSITNHQAFPFLLQQQEGIR